MNRFPGPDGQMLEFVQGALMQQATDADAVLRGMLGDKPPTPENLEILGKKYAAHQRGLDRRGPVQTLQQKLFMLDGINPRHTFNAGGRYGKTQAQIAWLRAMMAGDGPHRWWPPHCPQEGDAADDARGTQIAWNRTTAQSALRRGLGEDLWNEVQAQIASEGNSFHSGHGAGGTWYEDHGQRLPRNSPELRRTVMLEAVDAAQEGARVLLIVDYLPNTEHLANQVVGSPAEDTALLKTHDSAWQPVEIPLPKYRFPGGGWLILAPRDWLARSPGWVGTMPTTVDMMPSVVDWFSVPFPLGEPTSEESPEP